MVAHDRRQAAQIAAVIERRVVPAPTGLGDFLPITMHYDADLFRAFLDIRALLALAQELLARPGLAERILEVAGTHELPVPPGPSREELLQMLA